MKYLLLTLVTYCFFINITHAQKGKVVRHFHVYSNMTTIEEGFFWKETKGLRFAITTSFAFDFYLGNRLAFVTGLGLADKGLRIHVDKEASILTSPSGAYPLDYSIPQTNRLHTYYAEVPLGIKYDLDLVKKWYINTGFAVQIPIFKEGVGVGKNAQDQRIVSKQRYPKGPILLASHLGFGRNFAIARERMCLSVEVRAERELTDLFKSFPYYVHQSLGFSIGLLY